MANNILKTFGSNLKNERATKKMSQEDLAHKAGFDRTYISLIERGLRNPTLMTIKALADSLKISVSALTKNL